MASVSASSSTIMGAPTMIRCRQWLTAGRGQLPEESGSEPEVVQSPVALADLDAPALPISPVSMPESIETISGDVQEDASYYQEWPQEEGLERSDDTPYYQEEYVDQTTPMPVVPSAAAIARIFSIGQVQAGGQVLQRAWRMVRTIPRALFTQGVDRICQTALRETLAAESSLDSAIRQLEKTKSTRSSSFRARADRVHMWQGKLLCSIHILFTQVAGQGRSRHYRYYLPEDDQIELDRGFSESVLFAAQALARGFQIRGTEPYTVQLREPAWLLCSAWAALRFVLYARSSALMRTWRGESVEALRTVLVDFDEAWVRFERDLCFAYFGLDDGQAAAQEEEFALLVVLLSETMQGSVRLGLFSEDDVESMDPQLILALPRLAILHAIVKGADGLQFTEEPAFWWFREFVAVSRRIASMASGWSDEQYRVLQSMLAADEADEAWDKFAAAEELAMSRELDSVSLVCEQPPASCSSNMPRRSRSLSTYAQ
ncbi:hypothetical protein DL89DRAFT_45611 [Linderina pennispora]|uniref:Uncharacterized protein n=1 Tax=Linderina pennispora TaxID=61395 RepID=A0A1Y1W1U6_9FUNG|nr:uncharacterized protein DL89DRAFT_45611 [Linderina pennispora]ORX67500.1 hypothetical protein DL89DRAFT_45611 [Linderina pennispora]